jgi:hypothetical protein
MVPNIINFTAELLVIMLLLATILQVLISCYDSANMSKMLLSADPHFLKKVREIVD